MRDERPKTFSDSAAVFRGSVKSPSLSLIAHVRGARKHINPQHVDVFNLLFIGKSV